MQKFSTFKSVITQLFQGANTFIFSDCHSRVLNEAQFMKGLVHHRYSSGLLACLSTQHQWLPLPRSAAHLCKSNTRRSAIHQGLGTTIGFRTEPGGSSLTGLVVFVTQAVLLMAGNVVFAGIDGPRFT